MPNNITEAFRKAHCGKTSIPPGKEVCAFFFFFFEDAEDQSIVSKLELVLCRLDKATAECIDCYAEVERLISYIANR